jgi:D-alanyl-D-alanine carboxypeptidase
MKKIVLITLTLLFGMEAVAQYADPKENTPGYYFQIKKDFPYRPVNTANISGRGQNSYVSTAFDPTWADRFQTVLDSVAAASGVKGVSAAVLVPGQGLWTGVSGISHEGVPITSEMRFGFASNTKLYIAVTLEKLQEEGVLSLDDHLYQWLPSYPYVDSTATIRQLLSHQSGIFDFWNDHISFFWNTILADTSRFFTPDEVLATIGAPHFAPGHGYSYSNTNYLLAGMVIEAATGESWVQQLHNIIFDPLFMDSTFVGAFEPRNGPVAHEWVYNYGENPNSPMTSAYSFTNASAAILSTPQEMVAWYSALFKGEIISEASLQEILDFDPSTQYGLGISEYVINNSHYTYLHSGAMIGCLSQMVYDVQTKSVFCVVTNDRNIDFGVILYPLMNVLYNEYPKQENDAGITEIVSPWENVCNSSIMPSVFLTNFGSSQLTSVDINYQIDENALSTFNWTGDLSPGDTTNVVLPIITAEDGYHTFTCFTSLPNSAQEGNTYNDASKSNFIANTSQSTVTILSESFDGDVFPPDGWTLSSSSMFQWGQTPLSSFSGTGSLVRSNYNDGNTGAYYDINLPVIHIAEGTDAILEFLYAYAMYPGGYYGDSLQVYISNDCGETWQTLFNKGGFELHTYGNTNKPFYPQTSDQWKEETFLLDAYTSDVLIRFRAINGYSNNLFIDDISVSFVTSTDENNLAENFKVYPNPATNEFNFSGLPVNSQIQLTDLTGKLLITKKVVENQSKIEIGQLPNGVYILRTVLGTKKIVKM